MPASQFQSFDDTTNPSNSAPRLTRLRTELDRLGLDGFVVPRADEHQNEYVPESAQRLAWITGFTGSAGTAVVLRQRAAVFVDGRYIVQARAQVDTNLIAPFNIADTAMETWIENSLPTGGRLGCDPWLHTSDSVKRLERAARAAGGELVLVDVNPIDTVWTDRPAAPQSPIKPHPMLFAGEESRSKLRRVREELARLKCDALVVSDPHNLAWLFNIRGGDVAHTPLPLGYALVPREGEPTLFVDAAKMTPDARAALVPLGRLAEPDDLLSTLGTVAGRRIRIRLDSATGGHALEKAVEVAGGIPDLGPDPISLMKAAKNPTEREGARSAHRRDGVAMARFLSWFSKEAPNGQLTEIDAIEALEDFRRQTNALADISFPTIAGAGPNAALPHYRATRSSNRRIEPGIFLIDSGAQYEDGTTDITRTVAVGPVTDEMRDRYTRVLKGHIAIATCVFPKGTSGAQIDAFARRPLWEAGLDFDHGTGHGIGSFLSVHEGPQRIAKIGTTPLEAGMMLSNEPGYYKEGAYGIRIENLILVEERSIPGAERPMLGFETLTLAPIDLALLDPALMTRDEILWLNAYHARVREALSPALDGEAKVWLERATRDVHAVTA